jgi:Ca2+-binding RTX toxin-like protein
MNDFVTRLSEQEPRVEFYNAAVGLSLKVIAMRASDAEEGIKDEDLSVLNKVAPDDLKAGFGIDGDATVIGIPKTVFHVSDGNITGALDSVIIADASDRVVVSIGFDSMTIERLMDLVHSPAKLQDALYAKNDLFNLGDGNDLVSSFAGDDEIHVGGGNNVVHAGSGNDVVSAVGAASGNNKLYGEAGNDRMDGWNGKDILVGGAGADTLYGWGSNDKLDGGKDADRLTGGIGADILTGGAGKDIFDFNTFDAGATKATRDTIADFHRGEDKLELAQFQIDGAFGEKLVFIGSKPFTDSGQVRFEKAHGDLVVEVNYQGDKEAKFAILIKNTDSIGKADLIL